MCAMRVVAGVMAVGLASLVGLGAQGPPAPPLLDKAAGRWVEDTLRKMTLDDKVGQLIVPALDSTYLATDSAEFERLANDVTHLHVGGFHVFGGKELAPAVLLDT